MGELLFCRLEMSSSLERDYDEFEFSRENQLEVDNVEEKLQKFGEYFFFLNTNNSTRRFIGCCTFLLCTATKVGNEFETNFRNVTKV